MNHFDPGDLGRRYLPFLVFLTVMALMIALAPSKGLVNAVGTDGYATAGTAVVEGPGGGAAGGSTGAEGPAGTGGVSPTLGGGGTSSGPGAAAGGPRRPGAAGPGPGTGGSGPPDRSDCMPDGSQRPGRVAFFYMPPCVPVWHGGNNGGATMLGVTATEIHYVVYVPQVPAIVSQIGAAAGVTDSPDQICASGNAFNASLQKYFVMYGRKLVPMDGPGSDAGSKQADNGCQYPYYQSQCPLAPPDQACLRADADTIASMKPTFVLYDGDDTLASEFAADHVVALGYPAIPYPAEWYQKWAPYIWSWGADGTFQAGIGGQYFCRRLANHPPKFGGSDVQQLPYPPNRNVGIIYPEDNGDPVAQLDANVFLNAVHGCGDADAKGFSYASDPTTISEQAQTLVASLQANHVTTAACYCDPISLLFILQAAQHNNYHPEWLSLATSGYDNDGAGQLFHKSAPDEWIHAFGIGVVPVSSALSDQYKRAYSDGGGTGNESVFDGNTWQNFFLMGEMIQAAGPQLTLRNLVNGAQGIPAMGGSFEHQIPTGRFQAWGAWRGNNSDPLGDPIRDVAEIWWNPGVTSRNGSAGAYCFTNGGERVQSGQWPATAPDVFNPKDCTH